MPRKGRKRPREETSSSIDHTDDKSDDHQPRTSLLNNHFHSQLPSYLSEAFSDLYAQDGLVVMGRGLGWLGLLAAFCRFYGDPEGYANEADNDKMEANDDFNGANTYDKDGKRSANNSDSKEIYKTNKKPPLIFILNLRENERAILLSTLSSWGTPTSQLPTLITNESGQTKDRSLLYARGGLFIITSRILIVDLLNGTARPQDMEGMLVAHAEKVNESSTEAFILRIFRGQKYHCGSNGGFVKAFSDDASSLVRGFAKVDKIMKSLQVPKLYLYPRFHASVAEELEVYPPKVEELHVELSESMKKIQGAIAAAVRACMRDLRSRCPMVDFSELFRGDDDHDVKKRKIEAASKGESSTKQWEIDIKKIVSTNFDLVISKQLQGDWHRLGPDVKQRISDLTSLRRLFYQLIQSDCVSFWRTLEGIKARSLGHSSWIVDKVGERLFELAKARVYRIKPSNGKTVKKLERVLEENPKERLVQQLLTEIQNRWDTKAAADETFPRSANVLMMVKDGYTLRSLQSFISLGKDLAMEEKWRRYLKIANEKTKSLIGSVNGGINSLTEEQRLLFENDYADKNIVDLNENLRELDRKRDKKRRHDKITAERTRGVVDADAIRNRARLEDVLEESKIDIVSENAVRPTHESDGNDSSDVSSSGDDDSDGDLELGYRVKPVDGLNLIIRAFDKLDDGEAELLLRDTMPSYVILYDNPDPNFVRSLEIYSNSIQAMDKSADQLQVFFLLYESSAEESSFLQILDREKKAFDRLIEHQKRMPSVMPTFNNFSTQEMQLARGGVGGSYASGAMVRHGSLSNYFTSGVDLAIPFCFKLSPCQWILGLVEANK